jgi:phosphatidylinositol glycan class M
MLLLHSLNPINIILCTRGSSDAISNYFLLYTINTLLNKNFVLSGFVFGVLIHFRIYPIIYIFTFICHIYQQTKSYLTVCNDSYTEGNFSNINKYDITTQLFIYSIRQFVVGMFVGVLFLTSISYLMYGNDYIQQSILYHVFRSDYKHNFSFHFYNNYLHYNNTNNNVLPTISYVISKVSSFIPQILLLISVSYYITPINLFVALYLQTHIFVTFNKVITAQYFSWFIALLPLIITKEQIFFTLIKKIEFFCWCLSVCIWLFLAYLLEYQGYSVYLCVWLASQVFFWVNVVIIVKIVDFYKQINYYSHKKVS